MNQPQNGAGQPLSREEQLQVIYQYSHEDCKGLASDRWPRQHQLKPTLIVLENGITTLKLLEDLTDEQILDKLPGCLFFRARDLVIKELASLGWLKNDGPEVGVKQVETSDGLKYVYAEIRKVSTTQIVLALFCEKSGQNCLGSKTLMLPPYGNQQRFAELIRSFVANVDQDVTDVFAKLAA